MKDRDTYRNTDRQRRSPVPPGGLADLNKVELIGHRRKTYEEAIKRCNGSPAWKRRKEAEAYDLLALSEICPRLDVDFLDLRETLRAFVFMYLAVPIQPDAQGRLRVAPMAILGIRYPEEATRSALPGTSFVQVIQPQGVWHPNCSVGNPQILCIGDKIPAGIRLKEIVLLSYGALCMQNVMLDEQDPAGLLNPEAAKYWQHNLNLAPLTREAFLDRS